MTARLIALALWLLLLALALLLPERPSPLAIDPSPAAVTTGDTAAANRFLSPCPLTPRNIPRRKELT